MLLQLAIQNYATVDSLEIDFGPGMIAISGETGAGKSIMLDGLGLTLGDRADKSIVRSGARKAEICAVFDISHIPAAEQWLDDHELKDDNEPDRCLLRRVVGDDGRSKGFINGSPATLGDMTALGEMLIDIHSQHEHQSLLQRATHQRMLDEFSVDAASSQGLADAYKAWHKNSQRITALSESRADDSAQVQLLSYQLAELDELALADEEFEALEAEFKILNSADDTLGAAQAVLDCCSGNGDEASAADLLTKAHGLLAALASKGSRLGNAASLIESAAIQLDEAIDDLRLFVDGFEADPERLEQVNERLGLLHAIARKHKIKPQALPAFTADMRAQLESIANSDQELETLRAADAALRTAFSSAAAKVSKQRKTGAKSLAKRVNEQLLSLGMPHARLEVALSSTSAERPTVQGAESVEFLVSTNPGIEAKPLIKIASGGELSRISLAIQVVTAQTSRTPSLVFDEVDVGIGGGVAKIVGELLRQLGATSQVLCVTHQAQVAGQGHSHYFVSKSVATGAAGEATLTRIERLDDAARLKEVARMLGGDDYSAESLAHAQKMLVLEPKAKASKKRSA
jgi:DNA repair protein RecN (Recombination protein N)